jgi:5-methylcytosine-specific restriction endonuclease McrA
VLRRTENVSVSFSAGFFSGKGLVYVTIGSNRYIAGAKKIHKDEFMDAAARQQTYPVVLIQLNERTYWQFQDRFYWENDDLDAEAVYALLVTKQQRERRRVERAVATVAMGAQPRVSKRGQIPDDLKQYVWQRDGGRCSHCGAVAELQFDHIIPVAKGGATSEENLQILCGPCNRRKSDGLTIR